VIAGLAPSGLWLWVLCLAVDCRSRRSVLRQGGFMYFVGLDLAWGARARTGVAVLDDSGRLLHVSSQHTDDQIVGAIGPYVADECLVAIDAPLLVTNETGKRPAEGALGADFHRFDAGPLPAAKKLAGGMFDPPRGSILAERLGLDIDPQSQLARRCIEVYPRPAMVAIFRLGCTLKFKKGKGKGPTPEARFAHRKSEMLMLIDLIQNLASASPTLTVATCEEWAILRDQVETATRVKDLNDAEDPIDAVFCAYVAMYFAHRRHDITIYGEYPTNGYIATPTLPAGLKPTCREQKPQWPHEDLAPSADLPIELDRLRSGLHALEETWAQLQDELDIYESAPRHHDPQLADRVGRTARKLQSAQSDLIAALEMLRRGQF
jgi:predicted RNase H-like nuclease